MELPREIPVSGPPPAVPSGEVARLEAMHRLAMGAAHAMNNAFTAVVGETQFLCDDHKHEPAVVEACELILAQIERCTRITSALLTRRDPSQGGASAVDLARLVRELGNLLDETLGRGAALEVHHPDDLVLVHGDPASLEVAALTLVHYATEQGSGSTRLRLGAEVAGGPGIQLDVERGESVGLGATALRDPGCAEDPLLRSQLQALHDLAAAQGGQLRVRELGPRGYSVRLELPRLD
ncbi:MAG: hypothetical protein ACR2PQ_07865 [Myxococcota bacterium]